MLFDFSTPPRFPRGVAALVGAAIVVVAHAAVALPPNTALTLLADVSSTTHANDAFWLSKCAGVPPTALYVVVEMGSVVDFFRPVEGATWCEMLTSLDKHQWSSTGVDGSWLTPVYYNSTGGINGGSAHWWPRDNLLY